jgi:DNA replication protein DnaC
LSSQHSARGNRFPLTNPIILRLSRVYHSNRMPQKLNQAAYTFRIALANNKPLPPRREIMHLMFSNYVLSLVTIHNAGNNAAGQGLLLFGPPGCGKSHLVVAAARRATLITTNLSLEELEQKVGPRTMDRLVGSCRFVENCAASYRQEQALILTFSPMLTIGTQRC